MTSGAASLRVFATGLLGCGFVVGVLFAVVVGFVVGVLPAS